TKVQHFLIESREFRPGTEMHQHAKPVYFFGNFRLDPSERLLLRDKQVISLTPKVFEALVLLVENAGHLVEKDEFMSRLWPDSFVGEDALAQNISLLRKALADNHGSMDWIITVSKRGYRFAPSVVEGNGHNAREASALTSDATTAVRGSFPSRPEPGQSPK